MKWTLLEREEKISKVIEYAISKNTEINLRIAEIEHECTSRFVEIMPGALLGKGDISTGPGPELLIEKLTPDIGNDFIQRFPEAAVEFPVQECLCRFDTRCSGTNSIYPYYGILLDFPACLELEEKRQEDRVVFEFPEKLSARIRLPDGSRPNRFLEFSVIDTSSRGLGLLVTKGAYSLIAGLGTGDPIPELVITSTAVKLEAVVRHKTKIEDGAFKGSYILGLETSMPHQLSSLSFETCPVPDPVSSVS
jgi:hypothetical protein